MDPTQLSLVAGLVTLLAGGVVTFITYQAQSIQAKQSEIDKNDYLKKLEVYATSQERSNKEILELTNQLKNGSDKLFELQQQLVKSQATVIRLTEEDRNTFSGSDSYCYADIIAITKGKAMVTVTHVGKYPLSDIIIYMRPISKDMELAEHPELQTYQRMMELAMSNKRIIVGNLPAEPKNSRMVDEITFNHLIPETYYLEFVAKNGSWAQICDFQYGKDGKIRYAYKVVRIEQKGAKRRETELKRYITPGYPNDGVVNKELEKGFY